MEKRGERERGLEEPVGEWSEQDHQVLLEALAAQVEGVVQAAQGLKDETAAFLAEGGFSR